MLWICTKISKMIWCYFFFLISVSSGFRFVECQLNKYAFSFHDLILCFWSMRRINCFVFWCGICSLIPSHFLQFVSLWLEPKNFQKQHVRSNKSQIFTSKINHNAKKCFFVMFTVSCFHIRTGRCLDHHHIQCVDNSLDTFVCDHQEFHGNFYQWLLQMRIYLNKK